jgi:TPR repeat protein
MLKTGRNPKALFKLIKPYIKTKDPDALYLYSCFSLPEWGETDESFFARRFKYLRFAAQAGHAEAIYELGLVFHTGYGGIEQDKRKAAQHFKAAAEKGHPHRSCITDLIFFMDRAGSRKMRFLNQLRSSGG